MILAAVVYGGSIYHTAYSPSQSPTLAPTDTSYFYIASPFETWTPEYVHQKVQAFYGNYVIYFSGLFLLLFIIDKATIKGKTLKSLSAKLAESSEASKIYKREKIDLSSEFLDALKDIVKTEIEADLETTKDSVESKAIGTLNRSAGHRLTLSNNACDIGKAVISNVISETGKTVAISTETFVCKHIKRLRSRAGMALKRKVIIEELKEGVLRIDDMDTSPHANLADKLVEKLSFSAVDDYKPWPHDDTPRMYDDTFYNFIANGGQYSGCRGVVWPDGYTIPWIDYTLRAGVMEDFLLYIFNNHTLLSCICALKKSIFSRNKRRIAFTMEHSLAFFLVAFNTSLVSAGMSPHLAVLINLFVISPSSSLYNAFFHDLLTCPCIQEPSYRKQNPSLTALLEYIGLAIAFPLMIGGLALLVLAALFTVAKTRGGILLVYVLQVQLYGAVMQLLKAIAHFITPEYHLAIHIGSDLLNDILAKIHPYLDGFGNMTIIETGGWFIEKCDKEDLQDGLDTFNFSKNYLFGIIQYEFICSKDYALKRVDDYSIKWKVKESSESISEGLGRDTDVEMVTKNPLFKST